jgi:hypothetical protein
VQWLSQAELREWFGIWRDPDEVDYVLHWTCKERAHTSEGKLEPATPAMRLVLREWPKMPALSTLAERE